MTRFKLNKNAKLKRLRAIKLLNEAVLLEHEARSTPIRGEFISTEKINDNIVTAMNRKETFVDESNGKRVSIDRKSPLTINGEKVTDFGFPLPFYKID